MLWRVVAKRIIRRHGLKECGFKVLVGVPVVTIVSLSKTLNHDCFILLTGHSHRQIPQLRLNNVSCDFEQISQ